MSADLTVIWAALLMFTVFAYVALDGFDLGIGILFPLLGRGEQRDLAMNSVAPVWDGNETWLILGGGSLFAAFPLAYAIIMPAVYAPLIAMLLGLILRGVAFEYRWRTRRAQGAWDIAFTAGSTIAAFTQGVMLGAILQGIAVSDRAYSGGWWDWLTAFTLLTGASVVVAYALLGSSWLIMKTTGALQALAYRYAWRAAIGSVGAIFIVSAATPFLDEAYYQRWFSFPRVLATANVPLLVAAVVTLLFVGLAKRWERRVFTITLVLFALCFVGLGISVYPDIVPRRVTLWEAAAPASSQLFMLVGAAILIPVILAYTAHAYWVFRGKVTAGGYH